MTFKTIDVTQEDIDNGQKGECSHCPIALAAKRAFPELAPVVSAYNLWVDSKVGRADGPGYPLPDKAVSFIQDFDRWRPVQPFSFKVRVD